MPFLLTTNDEFNMKMHKITNKSQFECLVRLMEQNTDIARGLVKSGTDFKENVQNRWELFKEELNSLGPPTRDTVGWIKVWTDLKYKIRQKLVRNKAELNETGGGPNKTVSFSALEESVIDLLNLNTMTNPPGTDFGFNENIPIETEMERGNGQLQIDDATQNVEPSCSHSQQKQKKSKSATIDWTKKRFELLKKQTELQENIYKSSVENNKYLRLIYKLQKEKNKLLRETIQIKKEKLELYKAELKQKKAKKPKV